MAALADRLEPLPLVSALPHPSTCLLSSRTSELWSCRTHNDLVIAETLDDVSINLDLEELFGCIGCVAEDLTQLVGILAFNATAFKPEFERPTLSNGSNPLHS